jgi:hypothetical protein
MWLDILTITDITAQSSENALQNEGSGEDSERKGSIQ